MPALTSAQWGAAAHETPDEHAPLPPVAGPDIDVLVPCYERPAELAVTLAGLAGQTDVDFSVTLSDQSSPSIWENQTVASMLTLLRAQGRIVTCHRNLPQRGLAQQRQFLLEHSDAPHVLFLDSDVWLESGALARLQEALASSGAGFVGSAVQGLSYLDDVRPEEWRSFELWDGPVEPEPIRIPVLHTIAGGCTMPPTSPTSPPARTSGTGSSCSITSRGSGRACCTTPRS